MSGAKDSDMARGICATASTTRARIPERAQHFLFQRHGRRGRTSAWAWAISCWPRLAQLKFGTDVSPTKTSAMSMDSISKAVLLSALCPKLFLKCGRDFPGRLCRSGRPNGRHDTFTHTRDDGFLRLRRRRRRQGGAHRHRGPGP